MDAPHLSGEPPPVDSEEAFRAAVIWAAAQAVQRRCRRLICCAPQIEPWPLSEPAFLGSLSELARLPGREVVIVAGGFGDVRRVHPRFVRWRQTWSHAFSALQPMDESVQLPVALLADRELALEITDQENWVGVWRERPVQRQALIEEVEELMRRSEPAFPLSVLGL